MILKMILQALLQAKENRVMATEMKLQKLGMISFGWIHNGKQVKEKQSGEKPGFG